MQAHFFGDYRIKFNLLIKYTRTSNESFDQIYLYYLKVYVKFIPFKFLAGLKSNRSTFKKIIQKP